MNRQEKQNKLATTIRKCALRTLIYDLKQCDERLDFWSSAEHACEDYLSVLEVAHLLDANKPAKACREAWDLDTSTRDTLPESMWKLMDQYNDCI